MQTRVGSRKERKKTAAGLAAGLAGERLRGWKPACKLVGLAEQGEAWCAGMRPDPDKLGCC